MRIEVDGEPTFVAARGASLVRSQRVVLLLHGAGMAPVVWAGLQGGLADATTAVLAPALPGHGAGSRGSGGTPPATIEAYAAWTLRLLDVLGGERAVVVGHSMGALIALATALAAPDRIAAVAALGAAARMPVHPKLLEQARTAPGRAAEQILGWGFARPQAQRPPSVALVPLARRVFAGSAAGVLAGDLAACDGYAALTAERLSAIRCPALVVVATRDRMTPAKAGRTLAAGLPHGSVVELPGIGHMAPVEAPAAVAQALRAWLRGLAGDAAGVAAG